VLALPVRLREPQHARARQHARRHQHRREEPRVRQRRERELRQRAIDMGDLYSTPRTSLRSDARISLTLLRRARRPPARRPRIPCRTMFAVPDTVKQTASTVWSALQPLKLDTPGLPPMLPGGLPVVGHAVEMRTGPVR
jgi:hypothetical protein